MSVTANGTAPVAQVLQQLRALASHDTRTQLQQLSPDDRGEWLVLLQQVGDAVDAATVVATEVFDTRGDGVVLGGAASTQAWIRTTCRVSAHAASERVRIARASRCLLTEPLAKVVEGSVTFDHLRAIERSTRRLDPEQQSPAVRLLTELAEVASVDDLRVAGRHAASVVDPDGTLRDTERQFDRRYLTLAPLMDGMTAVDGLLDAEAAAIVDAALQRFLTPDGPTDVRSTRQRRADGLVQLLGSACDHGEVPTSGGERPHLSVVVDRDGAARLAASGEPVHPVSLTRVSCDSHFTALLLDTEGVVVDLGRTRRLFSGQQRKLLAARDGGCRWPGCHRPPGHTDAHHVIPWQEGGATDVSNALLLCRFHHRLVHEGQWHVRVVDSQRGSNGAVTMTAPLGMSLTSEPRGP